MKSPLRRFAHLPGVTYPGMAAAAATIDEPAFPPPRPPVPRTLPPQRRPPAAPSPKPPRFIKGPRGNLSLNWLTKYGRTSGIVIRTNAQGVRYAYHPDHA